MKKNIDSLKHELKQLETIFAALTVRKNKKPQSYWTADQSASQADLCLFLRMFSPDCGLFTKHKNEQWKFIEEQLLSVLSKAAVDAKEEVFTWRRAVLQEQLEEAQQALLPDEDEGQGGKILSMPELTMRRRDKTQSLQVQAWQRMMNEMTMLASPNQFLMDGYVIKHK